MSNVPENLKETSVNKIINGETPITFKLSEPEGKRRLLDSINTRF